MIFICRFFILVYYTFKDLYRTIVISAKKILFVKSMPTYAQRSLAMGRIKLTQIYEKLEPSGELPFDIDYRFIPHCLFFFPQFSDSKHSMNHSIIILNLAFMKVSIVMLFNVITVYL